jgi:hypothetical protein
MTMSKIVVLAWAHRSSVCQFPFEVVPLVFSKRERDRYRERDREREIEIETETETETERERDRNRERETRERESFLKNVLS